MPTPTSPPAAGCGERQRGSPAAVTLPAFDSVDLTIDFVHHPCTAGLATLSAGPEQQWHSDSGEPGLWCQSDSVPSRRRHGAASVTTDANGYLFDGLCLGDYFVEVDRQRPARHAPSSAIRAVTTRDAMASIIMLRSRYRPTTTDPTIDFGYHVLPPTVSRQRPAATTAGSVDADER
jgi:hypothetical protein